MMHFLVKSESDLPEVAAAVIVFLESCPVVCLYGEMGAGKTTLIKQIGKQLGVTDPMSSPTFAIVNEYRTVRGQTVYHFDFYRLKNLREAVDIGAEEYFFSGSACLMEWPEMVEPLIPEKHLKIHINFVEGNTRQITLELHGGGDQI